MAAFQKWNDFCSRFTQYKFSSDAAEAVLWASVECRVSDLKKSLCAQKHFYSLGVFTGLIKTHKSPYKPCCLRHELKSSVQKDLALTLKPLKTC